MAGRQWKGWWGDNPPYHAPIFVLTHHPREPIEMEGGTTFHFVTEGIDAALERAQAAAGGKDVKIGGGVATVRQYLRAGFVDESTSPSLPSCWAGASRCSKGSTCALWATARPNMPRPNTPPTSC